MSVSFPNIFPSQPTTKLFCAEWLAWVKRLMIWLSSLLGSSCAWSFASWWPVVSPNSTVWWIFWWILNTVGISLMKGEVREVSGNIAALFLGWRFALPSQQKTNVFGLQPLKHADVTCPKNLSLFPSQFAHVSGEPCWLSGDSPPISVFTRVSWLAAKKSERLL